MAHGYQAKNYTTSVDICTHNGVTEVFTVNECKVFAGSRVEVESCVGLHAIISLCEPGNLSGGRATPPVIVVADREDDPLWPAALTDIKPLPQLYVDWPDRLVPGVNINKQWWADLTEFIKGFKGNIGIHCLGGHGRTGTMLSILAQLCGVVPEGESPVAFVRAVYCVRAVESNTQLDYIEAMCGVEVHDLSSDKLVDIERKHLKAEEDKKKGGNKSYSGKKYQSQTGESSAVEGLEQEQADWLRAQHGHLGY